MKPITVFAKGSFRKTNSFLERAAEQVKLGTLNKYGREGVKALSDATPEDTGKTKDSWSYEISRGDGYAILSWHNSNVVEGANIALLLQYGHATRSGTWVEGTDYINPAMKPIFDKLAKDAWEELNE